MKLSGSRHGISAIASAVLWALAASTGWGQGPRPGDTVTLNWPTVEGPRVTNEAIKDRLVIVDFWATWCGPCMAQAEHMVKLSRDYRSRGVVLIGVSLDEDVGLMRRVARDKGFDWPQVCDGKGWDSVYSRAWNVRGIPETFIIHGPTGKLLWRGPPQAIDGPLEQAIKAHPVPAGLRFDAQQKLKEAEALLTPGEGQRPDYGGACARVAALDEATVMDATTRSAFSRVACKLDAAGPDAEAVRAALAAHPEAVKRLEKWKQTASETAGPSSGSSGGSSGAAAPPASAPATDPGSAEARAGAASARLRSADRSREAGDHPTAYRTYQGLARLFADTPSGAIAAERVRGYEADAPMMAAIARAQREDDARAMLAMGRSYAEAGDIEKARSEWKRIVSEYADTQAVVEARKLLGE